MGTKVLYPYDPYSQPNYTCFGNSYPPNNPNFALDADISGIGVTISFLLTAIGTFTFVVYGFSRNLLTGSGRPHRSDQLAFTWLRFFIDTSINILPKWIVTHIIRPKPVSTGEALERQKRVFSTAVQMMGDQQLVIGLAYLYGGLSSPCTLSLYSLKNLAAISWLSSVVHITTLVAVSRSSYSSQSNKGRFFRISLTIIMILTTMACTIAFALVQSIGATSQISQSAYSKLMNLEFDFELSIIPFSLFLLFGLWLSVFYFLKLWESVWPGSRGGLFSSLPELRFRVLARWYGVHVPEGLDYRRMRRISQFQKWVAYQDSIRGKTDQEQSSIGIAKLSRLQMLNAPLPEENKPAVSHDIFLLFFFLVQGTTRFLLSWVQLLDYEFAGVTFEWEALEWGTGQIIPIVMLLSSFFTWLSMSDNQTPDDPTTRATSDSPPSQSYPSPPYPHLLRNDTDTTLTDEPTLLTTPELAPHQPYLTPQCFYTLPRRITLSKLRFTLRLLLTIFTCLVQVLVSCDLFRDVGGVAYLVMLSLSLLAVAIALGRFVYRFGVGVRGDVILLRSRRRGGGRKGGEDGEEGMEDASDGLGVEAGMVKAEDEAEARWRVEKVRARLEDRLDSVREDRACLWEAEGEVRRGVTMEVEMGFLGVRNAAGGRYGQSCLDGRGMEKGRKTVGEIEGKIGPEGSGCEKGRIEEG